MERLRCVALKIVTFKLTKLKTRRLIWKSYKNSGISYITFSRINTNRVGSLFLGQVVCGQLEARLDKDSVCDENERARAKNLGSFCKRDELEFR